MKPAKPIGIFICALFAIGGMGMLLNTLLPAGSAKETTAVLQAATAQNNASAAEKTAPPTDIPVGSPTVLTAEAEPAPESVCMAALQQYLTYIDARAHYLLRAGQTQGDVARFLAGRDQAVIGELATLAAKTGTFQGNPDHFAQLTTLAAERQAVALASHLQQQPAADSPSKTSLSGGVKTYDFNLQC
ncbi:hypothetical protein [Adonisia turfae]|uniref:Uncharacterized protein n=1 Tax=Adonisia turfae CCMR0081 TaxID=2292702 RepID=A0A6M0RXY2_9CYAN|nr:hypothetical protein [Adonisia turfae]NEZ61016.1 hypothetical protein [Adonisia turfae CCMR0081]